MLPIESVIANISAKLIHTFEEVDGWFHVPEVTRNYQPLNGGWTINQILERISLTNHYLLILIEKGTRKALQATNKVNLPELQANYTLESEKLIEIGLYQSFIWIRPEHMEPSSSKSEDEVRQLLKEQLHQCIACLEAMPNGEGILYKTTMSVNNLGKLDVYQYLCFLAQHANRHLTLMQKVAGEYTRSSAN